MTAAGTGHGSFGGGLRNGRRGQGEVDIEEGLEELKGSLGTGVEEAVVADAVKSRRQHMEEVSADELDAVDADMASGLFFTVFDGNEDRMGVDGENASV